MITAIELTDFKCHAQSRVELGRLTVLVGPNGAGKTSVLQALGLVGRFVRVGLADFSDNDLISRRRTGRSRAALRLHGRYPASDPFSLEISIEPQGGEDVLVATGPRDAAATGVGSTTQLSLDPARLAAPSPPSARSTIEPEGSGLATVLAGLKLADDEAIDRITADLRAIVPTFRGLKVRQVNVGDAAHFQLELNFEGAGFVPADAASQGTLVALGILTVLHAPSRPRLLLLDDIDHALHPKAQWELIAILRRLLAEHPDLQIVATTHSPYVVDELQPEEVRVCALDPQGVAHVRSLADHPRAEELLSVLSTGELLSAEGEDWVVAAEDVARLAEVLGGG